MVQFSHLYMTTGKTTALTIQIFVGQVMSLLFNTLSRFAPESLLAPTPLLFLPLELFSFLSQLSATPGKVQFALA